MATKRLTVSLVVAILSSATSWQVSAFHASNVGCPRARQPQLARQQQQQQPLHQSFLDLFFPQQTDNNKAPENPNKVALLNLLSTVPANESTPKELTRQILQAVSTLEKDCPTPDEDVLPQLAGNWELIWTAQDKSSLPQNNNNPFAAFINPLENQSYSNNPSSGRSNPILPRNIQDGLEDAGILSSSNNNSNNDEQKENCGEESNNTIKSTQAINLKKNRIRNVVAFTANNPTQILSNQNGQTKGLITVDVKGMSNADDPRRIDVKFDACRVTILESPIDIKFPLGIVGPTGWLRTGYVDEDIRITRGHKGSVFILSRTAAKYRK